MLTRTGEILRPIHCVFASLRCPPRPVLPSGSSVLVGSAGGLFGGGGSTGSHALRSGTDITASSMQKRAPATKSLDTRGSFQFPDTRRVLSAWQFWCPMSKPCVRWFWPLRRICRSPSGKLRVASPCRSPLSEAADMMVSGTPCGLCSVAHTRNRCRWPREATEHPGPRTDKQKKNHSHRQRRPDRHAACPDWGPSNTQQEHRYDRQPSAA